MSTNTTSELLAPPKEDLMPNLAMEPALFYPSYSQTSSQNYSIQENSLQSMLNEAFQSLTGKGQQNFVENAVTVFEQQLESMAEQTISQLIYNPALLWERSFLHKINQFPPRQKSAITKWFTSVNMQQSEYIKEIERANETLKGVLTQFQIDYPKLMDKFMLLRRQANFIENKGYFAKKRRLMDDLDDTAQGSSTCLNGGAFYDDFSTSCQFEAQSSSPKKSPVLEKNHSSAVRTFSPDFRPSNNGNSQVDSRYSTHRATRGTSYYNQNYPRSSYLQKHVSQRQTRGNFTEY